MNAQTDVYYISFEHQQGCFIERIHYLKPNEMRVNWRFNADSEGEGMALIHYWDSLEVLPRKGDWVDVAKIVEPNHIKQLQKLDPGWEGLFGEVSYILLTKDEQGFYYEVWVECSDHEWEDQIKSK